MANARIVRDTPLTWNCVRDSEGYREYKIKWLIEMLPTPADPPDPEIPAVYYGPATALQVPGLPLPGSEWNFGGDVDVWVWCRPNAVVEPVQPKEGEGVEFFTIEQTFSNRPPGSSSGPGGGAPGSSNSGSPGSKRCHELQIEDPLLEPPRISGSFVNEKEEGVLDRFGLPIRNSAHEHIHGPQNEWDSGSDTVRIEANIAILNLPFLVSYKNAVNDSPLWGMPARTIKLSKYSWEILYYAQCNVYYKVVLEFEVRERGWDRDVPDEGTKALHGKWNQSTGHWELINIGGLPPDPENPSHFTRYQDRFGNVCRVILNGEGLPIERSAGTGTGADEPGMIHIEKYPGKDFYLLLGLPTEIES